MKYQAWLTLLLLGTANFVYPQVKHNKSLELEKVTQQINDTKIVITKQQQMLSVQEEELKTLDQELGKHHKAIYKINLELTKLEDKVLTLREKKSQLEDNLRKHSTLFSSYIKQGQRFSAQNDAKELINSFASEIPARNMHFYDLIAKKYQSTIQNISDEIASLRNFEKELKTVLSTAATQKSKIAELIKLIDKKTAQRKILIKDTKRELSVHNNLLKQYEQEKEEINKILTEISRDQQDLAKKSKEQGSFAVKEGSIIFPIKLADVKKRAHLNGMMIQAPIGTTVQAIYAGQVIFADWIREFGLVIIVRHDNDYISVYGNNQSLLKDKGEWVEQGEPISMVGDNGTLSYPGLYFEIRKKDNPVALSLWLGTP